MDVVFKKAGLTCLAALMLTGCNVESRDNSPVQADQPTDSQSSNNQSGTPTAPSCSLLDQTQQLAALFDANSTAQSKSSVQGLYYRTDAPGGSASTSPYLSLSAALQDMKHEDDRWSYVSESNLTDDPYPVLHRSLGFRWAPADDGSNTLVVLHVFENSPAHLGSLARGDTITQINGQPIPDQGSLTSEQYLNQIRSLMEGYKVNITSTRGTHQLTRTDYSSPDISNAYFYTLADGRRAGYFYLDNFNNFIEDQYISLFSQMRAQNVTELIVDLRYNGGGLIYSAWQLAQLIVGSKSHGLLFNSMEYNAYHTSKNEKLNFNLDTFSSGIQQNALQLDRVIFLTGENTASSSEILINGLKPHIDTVVIGSQTHGKPYGMRSVQICNSTVWPISFVNINANLQPIPTDGIQPWRGCEVADEPNVSAPLGFTSEPMLARALNYLNTGGCFAPL